MSSSPDVGALTLRPFNPADQAAVRTLILTGLGSRFGTVDETLNPDLDDIQCHYVDAGETVLVLESTDGVILGCGMLHCENGSATSGRIARVSVIESLQGLGLGRRISRALIDHARQRGFTRLLVETNDNWASALRLYQSLGFTETHRVPVPQYGYTEVHMALELARYCSPSP
jgi:GNAT superfamily N-acetyltransferase